MSMHGATEVDLIEYAKRYLLDHMRAEGMSEDEIEAKILAIPNENPLKNHFISQFTEPLPEPHRTNAVIRLLQLSL